MYRGLSLLFLSGLCVLCLYLPVKIPYNLLSVANVLPMEEWRLVQDVNGSLAAVRQNHKRGLIEKTASWQFERGDISGMEVTVNEGWIREGDTIVRMYSAAVQQQIIELENQLKIRQSEQQVLVTGEKPPIVQEAESRLEFAQKQKALALQEYQLAKKVYEEGVSTKIEYIRAENALEQAATAVQIAEKALLNAQTGVKMESVGVNDAQIGALRRQLNFLRSRNAGFVITAPFSGRVTRVREPGEVLVLQRVSECVALVPVRIEEAAFVTDSASFDIIDAVDGRHFKGILAGRQPQTFISDGKSVIFMNVEIQNPDTSKIITLGLGARCTINCGDLNPRAYLRRLGRFSVSGK